MDCRNNFHCQKRKRNEASSKRPTIERRLLATKRSRKQKTVFIFLANRDIDAVRRGDYPEVIFGFHRHKGGHIHFLIAALPNDQTTVVGDSDYVGMPLAESVADLINYGTEIALSAVTKIYAKYTKTNTIPGKNAPKNISPADVEVTSRADGIENSPVAFLYKDCRIAEA